MCGVSVWCTSHRDTWAVWKAQKTVANEWYHERENRDRNCSFLDGNLSDHVHDSGVVLGASIVVSKFELLQPEHVCCTNTKDALWSFLAWLHASKCLQVLTNCNNSLCSISVLDRTRGNMRADQNAPWQVRSRISDDRAVNWESQQIFSKTKKDKSCLDQVQTTRKD